MKIKIDGGDLKIGITELIESLSSEQKKEIIHSIACNDDVIKRTIDYICDEDEEGWYSGSNPELRQQALVRIEKKQLETLPTYYWRVWEDLQQELNNIRSKEQVYWSLYHGLGDEFGDEGKRVSFQVLEMFRKMGIESNYTTKQAEDYI